MHSLTSLALVVVTLASAAACAPSAAEEATGATDNAITAPTAIMSDFGTSSAMIRLAKGELAMTTSKIRPSDDDGSTLVSSCKTSSAVATIDMRSTATPDGILRGISFSGIAPRDPACVSMDAIAVASDAVGGDGSEGWWDITCEEDDVHASADGLTELVNALSTAANP